MHRYVLSSDITEERLGRYQYSFWAKAYADAISEAPVDDDTNYTVLYQQVIEKYSKDFTPRDVAEAWLAMQPKDAYCTAERVAFCNFVNGYLPPYSEFIKIRTGNGSAPRSGGIILGTSILATRKKRRRWPGGTPLFPM